MSRNFCTVHSYVRSFAALLVEKWKIFISFQNLMDVGMPTFGASCQFRQKKNCEDHLTYENLSNWYLAGVHCSSLEPRQLFITKFHNSERLSRHWKSLFLLMRRQWDRVHHRTSLQCCPHGFCSLSLVRTRFAAVVCVS